MAASALWSRFADVVERHGDRLALASPRGRWRYRDVGGAVDALAGRLRTACGDVPGPVGLVMPHGHPLAVATFAGFGLDRAVVPIDPAMPAPRRDAILADAAAVAVVSCDGDGAFEVRARDGGGTMVSHPRVVAPDAIAMVLYTSGSTGAPKGVVYSHDTIAARVVDGDRFGLGPDDRLGIFGAAGMNLFRALLRGAALVAWDVGRDGVAGIADWIAREEITQLHAIPTLLRRLADAVPPGRAFPRLRRVSITGEPLFAADAIALRRLFPPPVTLLNGLGTTEAGTFCQFAIDDTADGAVPVGFPVDGFDVALRDADDGVVADGAAGEIVVHGALLSSGYWRRPALEAQRFIDDPHDPARRGYRTGDLGRRRADGALLHLGRRDHQVKLRGVRIEPSEVEAVLRTHPAVRDVAVAGEHDDDAAPRLVACVAVAERRAELARELARWLRGRLPDAMVPEAWTFVDALPLTPGGKVDRRALPAAPPRSAPADVGLVARFLRAASATPDAVAYRFGGSTMRYAELERRSARLAARLCAHGVGRDGVVAIAVERSPSFAVCLLAVLRAGGACLPLDPRGPRQRNRTMLVESGARWLLAPPDLPFELADGVERLDPDASGVDTAALPPPQYEPERLAFVLYTSGSSGVPKGVALSERQVLHRLRWDRHVRPFAPGEVACQRGPTGFVDALAEWLGPLLDGVPTEIVPDALLRRPHALVDALATAGVTRILLVPSQLELLLQSVPDLGARLPSLRLWTASGEPLTRATVARFQAAVPAATLWNVYGATEAWDATCHRITPDDVVVPIGRPLPGMRAYVLDDALAPQPTGVAGELYVAGDGLALGYRGDEALTHARFVPNPFTPGRADRLYRTGDRARRTDAGVLEHLGRADRQVQVLGVRVELGEVEAALAAHPAVREAAAVERDGRVAAYVVAAAALDVAALRAHLRERLVPAALPREIVALTALPRTSRGKVDRAALRDADRVAPLRAAAAPAAPITLPTELEETVLQVFADLLHHAPIAVDDDFFDLGGDSLLAVQLVAELEALTGRVVPLDALAAAPTPRAIAAAIAAGGYAWDDAGCLTLHADAPGPPLFGLCGAWGFGVRLLRLGRALGDDVPLHALQPPGMTWPDGVDLRGIAAHYADEMVRLRPDGPYRLIGTSFGGVIALEVALQLEARGHDVALLAVVDSALPGSPLQPRLEFAPERASRLELIGHRVYMAHLHAAPSYRPAARVAAPMVYYRCAESTHAHHLSWRALSVREPTVVTVPGGHGAFHVQPQLGHIAADLRRRLFAPPPRDDAARRAPSLLRRLFRRARRLTPRFDGRPSGRAGGE